MEHTELSVCSFHNIYTKNHHPIEPKKQTINSARQAPIRLAEPISNCH